jgi:hypothetical protein
LFAFRAGCDNLDRDLCSIMKSIVQDPLLIFSMRKGWNQVFALLAAEERHAI